MPTYHGDKSRKNMFWVYHPKNKIVTPTWDFRDANMCRNHKAKEMVGDGV